MISEFLIVANDLIETGGMDVANHALAYRAADRSVRVRLVSHRVAPGLARHPNVQWTRVPRPLSSDSLGAPLIDLYGRRAARRHPGPVLVNGGNCSAAAANWVHYVHAAYARRAAVGGWRRAKTALDHRIALRDEARALARARLVIANSERTKQDLVQQLGLAESKIHVVYYGIDADRFRPTEGDQRSIVRHELGLPERPLAAFIGGLGDTRKGFDTLFDAFVELCRDRQWDVDLVVIGRGAELTGWQTRAAAAGLERRIHFLGFRSDVPRLLPALDLLVAPTRYEAYGLGVHEALCSGLPAVVSKDAGVAERYPPELSQLLLEDPNSAAELARRLRDLRSGMSELRGRILPLSALLRARTWNSMADDILGLLEP
jgi:glycosyltransferase involved in cell wall biosynthesis